MKTEQFNDLLNELGNCNIYIIRKCMTYIADI